jgi:small subunit ribosomal protein S5
MEKEKTNFAPSSEPSAKPSSEQVGTPKNFSSFETKRKPRENQKKRFSLTSQFDRVVLETKRTTKVTAGGRRFSFASPGLIKDKNKKMVTFAYTKGKEVPVVFQKMLKRAQRTFAHFSKEKPTLKVFPFSPRTVPHDIEVSYKNVLLRLFPAPPGSGIRAGGALRKLFKMIGFRDVSAKIIGSGSNLNVTRAAFLALSKIN